MQALMTMYHPTADQIFDAIHNDYPSISKGTVYRILNILSEDGEILHLPMPDGADRYDPVIKKHRHFRCKICNELYDIDIPEINDIENAIESKYGFSISYKDTIFQGICPKCLQNDNDESIIEEADTNN